MKRILNWLFPLEPVDAPAGQTPDKPATTARQMPDNIRTIAGQVFVHRDTLDGFEEELFVRQTGQRDARLTRHDIDSLTLAGLDQDKAVRLKALWAQGLSAQKAALKCQGERGYKARTVEKYFAIFNREASPLPAREG